MIKHLLLALSIAAFITALPDEDRVSSPPVLPQILRV
jgi:hypothetical protein